VEFTTETWMILGLTLALGWVLGLMSRSGGKRWKRDLLREREEHKAAIRNRDEQIVALKARETEYERTRSATAYRSDADLRETRSDLGQADVHDTRRDLRHDDRHLDTLETRHNPDGTRTVLPRP
jgi:hypothetical protein